MKRFYIIAIIYNIMGIDTSSGEMNKKCLPPSSEKRSNLKAHAFFADKSPFSGGIRYARKQLGKRK